MRTLLFVGWMLVALGGACWHYGPGQERLTLDRVSQILRNADGYAANEQWEEAEAAYAEALGLLPPEKVAEARRIRLERAKAAMLAHQLPDAHASLKSLVDEMQADQAADAKVLAEARSAMANSQYYMTWLMRLEGLQREAWEPEIEAARQAYRHLAEQAEAQGDAAAAKRHQEDLESAVRLARMDLSELQGLPLPSQ